MAFRCDNCKYIFDAKRTSCPFCGGRVYNDSSTNDELTSLGFSFAPGSNPKANPANQPKTKDPFQDLRQAFEAEHGIKQNKPDPAPTVIENNPLQTNSTTHKQKGSNFFSQFETPASSTNNIPTVNPRTLPTDSTLSEESFEQELRDLERQQRRAEHRYRLRSALNFLATIRWHTVFRILLVILAIIAVIFIWNNIHTILNIIITISLLIGGTWYLIRSLFRR